MMVPKQLRSSTRHLAKDFFAETKLGRSSGGLTAENMALQDKAWKGLWQPGTLRKICETFVVSCVSSCNSQLQVEIWTGQPGT